MKKSLFSILALLMMLSCQEQELIPENVLGPDKLYASIEQVNATRTSMDENNNVLWSEGDQLVAFMKTSLPSKFLIQEQSVGTTTGTFTKVDEEGNDDIISSGQEQDHNVVMYPYSSDIWCMKNDDATPASSYKLNVVLPENQKYAENSFADGAFPMVAVSSDYTFTFKNICGGIKLQFKGVDKIRTIRLEGLNAEKISGKSSVICFVNADDPIIGMDDSDASGIVTLDCGEGVQLSQDNPTTFILAVPPVTFEGGMKITVTDTDGFSRELSNTSSNTIKRSSLLTFPVITYSQTGVFELPEGSFESYELPAEGGTIEIPVKTNIDYEVTIQTEAHSWITLEGPTKALREETIILNVAANTFPETRTAEIHIKSSGETLKTITVSQEAADYIPTGPDYIDENGINRGPSVEIDGVVWAPVNCGYHETDYPYGKLYQWGRKYGQGYDEEYTGIYDATYPTEENGNLVQGPVSLNVGLSEANKDVFYLNSGGYRWWNDDVDYYEYRYLWNASESTSKISKSNNDPCPSGWRVPSSKELDGLIKNYSAWTDYNGQNGYWFSGTQSYSAAGARVFFPAAGDRASEGFAYNRRYIGCYWDADMKELSFDYERINHHDPSRYVRAHSIRCVQEAAPDFNLSLSDAIDLSAEGTANSYIVNEAGCYRFVPTKGNSTESVGAVYSVETLWETFGTDVTPSVGDLIKAVEYQNGWVVFETPGAFREGNAVIAAKDAAGTILWSWHIWLTDQPEEQLYYNNAGIMMDRNLGATSATPGDVGTLGLLYQWGRKDPFLGSSSISSNVKSKSTIIWPSVVDSNSENGTVGYSIKNPTTFIYGSEETQEDWISSSRDDSLWASDKTIYDPCPVGWRVPDGGIDGVWAIAFASPENVSNYPYNNSSKGFDFSGVLGEASSIWYPVTGYLNGIKEYEAGCLIDIGQYVHYLSVTPSGYSGYVRPFNLGFNGWIVPSYDATPRGNGNPVRCVSNRIIPQPPYLTLSEVSVQAPFDGIESKVIELDTNLDDLKVEVMDDVSWISNVALESGSVSTLTFAVAPNKEQNARSAAIRISSVANPDISCDLSVIQGYFNGLDDSNLDKSKYITYVEDYEYEGYGDAFDYNMYDYGTTIYSKGLAYSSKIECKFCLNSFSEGNFYISVGEYDDSIYKIYINQKGLNFGSRLYTWGDMGVSSTSEITLVLSGTTMIVNGKTISGIPDVDDYLEGYIWSGHYHERDDGMWWTDYTFQDGGKIYYAKGWNNEGQLIYIGGASLSDDDRASWKSVYYDKDTGKVVTVNHFPRVSNSFGRGNL